ncbi:hypothetical protein I6A84_34485, partial [Frankia sp. CNm7]|nr:hypothetical protein [Frankia nepalensis]
MKKNAVPSAGVVGGLDQHRVALGAPRPRGGRDAARDGRDAARERRPPPACPRAVG